jgi:hypothetical protein
MDIHPARTGPIQEEGKAKTNDNQEKLEATIGELPRGNEGRNNLHLDQAEDSMKYRVENTRVSLDHRTQGTQAEMGTKDRSRYRAARTLGQVTDDSLEELEICRREFKVPLGEVEARDAREFSEYSITETLAERGSYRRTGIGAGVAQTLKFDGLNSWIVSRRQFEIMAKHNGWTPSDNFAYLIVTLNEPPAHSLHSVYCGDL